VKVEVPPGKRRAEVAIHVPDTRLTGDVVDSKGNPAPGANLFLIAKEPSTETTDEHGKFELRGIEPGTFGIEAELGDESSGPLKVSVLEGSDTPSVHLVLHKPVVLKGTVSSAGGPVPGASLLGFPSVESTPYATADSARTDVGGAREVTWSSSAKRGDDRQ
jgi:hypothetical protein